MMQWLAEHSIHIMLGLLVFIAANIDSRLAQIRDLLSDLREIGWESPGWRTLVERNKLRREMGPSAEEMESYRAKAIARQTETP